MVQDIRLSDRICGPIGFKQKVGVPYSQGPPLFNSKEINQVMKDSEFIGRDSTMETVS